MFRQLMEGLPQVDLQAGLLFRRLAEHGPGASFWKDPFRNSSQSLELSLCYPPVAHRGERSLSITVGGIDIVPDGFERLGPFEHDWLS